MKIVAVSKCKKWCHKYFGSIVEWRLVNRRTLLNKQGDKMTATGEEQGSTTHCPKMKMNDKKNRASSNSTSQGS